MSPNKGYVLFTDAPKHSWSGMLTQERTTRINDKEISDQYQITYTSGIFTGFQKKWATLTKEADTIYVTFKKLSYYLYDAQVIV